jgi:hypothetical protein
MIKESVTLGFSRHVLFSISQEDGLGPCPLYFQSTIYPLSQVHKVYTPINESTTTLAATSRTNIWTRPPTRIALLPTLTTRQLMINQTPDRP